MDRKLEAIKRGRTGRTVTIEEKEQDSGWKSIKKNK